MPNGSTEPESVTWARGTCRASVSLRRLRGSGKDVGELRIPNKSSHCLPLAGCVLGYTQNCTFHDEIQTQELLFLLYEGEH